jgi:hypothetical protein
MAFVFRPSPCIPMPSTRNNLDIVRRMPTYGNSLVNRLELCNHIKLFESLCVCRDVVPAKLDKESPHIGYLPTIILNTMTMSNPMASSRRLGYREHSLVLNRSFDFKVTVHLSLPCPEYSAACHYSVGLFPFGTITLLGGMAIHRLLLCGLCTGSCYLRFRVYHVLR